MIYPRFLTPRMIAIAYKTETKSLIEPNMIGT